MKKVSKEENIAVEGLTWVLYGKPSTGKTSLASMIDNSILLDFDNGAKGTEYRNDVITDITYSEWISNKDAILKDIDKYQWVIVDALSTMMSQIETYIVKLDPSMSDPNKNMSLYGQIGKEFKAFCEVLRKSKKKLLFITHEDYDSDAKMTTYRVMGKMARAIVEPQADYITRLYTESKQRKLMFEYQNSNTFDLKNRGNIEPIVFVPDFKDKPTFATELAERLFLVLGKTRFANIEKSNYIGSVLTQIKASRSVDDLNEIINELVNARSDNYEILDKDKQALFVEMSKVATVLGCTYNRETKVWQ